MQPHGQEICFALLCVLAVMHVFWFYLILRIAYKLIKGTKAHEAGADECVFASTSLLLLCFFFFFPFYYFDYF